MGLLLSLYLEIQELLFTSGMVQGDIKYSYNCFRWYGIRLNIPWYPDCLTTINYVYKNSGETQELAADFTNYVDCLRVNTNFVWDECRVEQRVDSILNYLGLHSELQKIIMARQQEGTCKGNKIPIDGRSVYQLVG